MPADNFCNARLVGLSLDLPRSWLGVSISRSQAPFAGWQVFPFHLLRNDAVPSAKMLPSTKELVWATKALRWHDIWYEFASS